MAGPYRVCVLAVSYWILVIIYRLLQGGVERWTITSVFIRLLVAAQTYQAHQTAQGGPGPLCLGCLGCLGAELSWAKFLPGARTLGVHSLDGSTEAMAFKKSLKKSPLLFPQIPLKSPYSGSNPQKSSSRCPEQVEEGGRRTLQDITGSQRSLCSLQSPHWRSGQTI